jgi:uncharacterized protein DUF6152
MQRAFECRVSFAVVDAVCLAIVCSSAPAFAHHGWGGYLDQTTDISGTVESPVSLAGPHATMTIRADGQVWDVVLAPPARTERAGLKENMIPVGAQVTVHGNRHRDPKRFEIKTTRLTWNGRVFNVYPDRS